MSEEWLSAAEAYRLVAEVTNPYLAQRAICCRASDGMLAARARRLILGDRTVDESEVPPGFWWARGEAALTQNWTTGDFETWIDQRVYCRAYGVEFRRPDIEAMLPNRGKKQTFQQSGPGNYASAARCLAELRKALDCDQGDAERLILRGCRAGLIPARCSTIWSRVTNRYGAQEDERTNVAIPDWFWEQCLDDQDTILNWQKGRFAGRGVMDGDEYKAIVSGVEFHVGAIVEIEATEVETKRVEQLPADDTAGKLPETGETVGRRLSERWPAWIAELVAYVHEHGIPAGIGSQGQEEVITGVAKALAERGEETFARSTVQPAVQAMLDRLRSAEN
jgi:hypothetical protein